MSNAVSHLSHGSNGDLFRQLPLETFFNIVSELGPLEMFVLTTVNASFRQLLLCPSAMLYWQLCLDNTGIPHGWSTMNARDYLSLWFRRVCTECHQPTSRLADLHLEVRLCSQECMEKVLVTRWLVPAEIREHLRSSSASSTFRRKRTYYLRSEVEAVKQHYADISGDQAAMSSWEQTQRNTQAENSSRAQKTIELIVSIRSNWEEGLRARYAEEVLRRLEHTPFGVQVVKLLPDRVAAFDRLIRQPKLFDEQEWVAQLKPSVMRFLKKNVRDTPRELRKRLAGLLESTQATIQLPKNFSRLPLPQLIEHFASFLPVPRFEDLCDEPLLRRLLNSNFSVDEMETEFDRCFDEISKLLVSWGEGLKKDLAQIARQGRLADKHIVASAAPRLTADRRYADLLRNLDRDSWILLLSDTMFSLDTGHGTRIVSFADIVISTSDRKHLVDGKLDRFKFKWSYQASEMARRMVRSNLMPVTLSPLVEHSRCPHCEWSVPSGISWSSLVTHYIDQYVQREKALPRLEKLLSQGEDPRPESSLLPYRFVCLVCERARVQNQYVYEESEMLVHLQAAHRRVGETASQFYYREDVSD